MDSIVVRLNRDPIIRGATIGDDVLVTYRIARRVAIDSTITVSPGAAAFAPQLILQVLRISKLRT